MREVGVGIEQCENLIHTLGAAAIFEALHSDKLTPKIAGESCGLGSLNLRCGYLFRSNRIPIRALEHVAIDYGLDVDIRGLVLVSGSLVRLHAKLRHAVVCAQREAVA